MEVARQQQLLLERRPERTGAEQDQRQPHAQSAEVLRELGREVGGRDLGRIAHGVLHVRAPVLVGRRERLRVAADDDAGAVGQEQSLVRIQHDRVRALDPLVSSAAVLREQEEAAVRRVHVEPAALPFGHPADRVERIHRPGVHGPGGGEHEPRTEPRGPVGGDGRSQRVGAHAVALVHRHVAERRLPKPGDAEGLLQAVMRLAS